MSHKPLAAALAVSLAACSGGSTGPEGDGGFSAALVGQVQPGPSSQRYTDVWGYRDPASGREYALVGSIGELFVVDASDPANPVTVATLAVPAFDIKVWGTYAYTVTGRSDAGTSRDGRIVDLSDPANPRVVGSFPSSHNLTIDPSGVMYLEAPGLRLFDLTADPLDPGLIWATSPANGHDATVAGGLLFDFHGTDGKIYDLRQPRSPRLLARLVDPSISYYHSGWPTEDGGFLFLTDELSSGASPDISIWDIADPSDPIRVAEISDADATVHNLMIVGDLAYVSYYSAGFRVYDVTRPVEPVELFHYDTSLSTGEGFVGAFGVYQVPGTDMVYVSDVVSGLHIFQVSTEP